MIFFSLFNKKKGKKKLKFLFCLLHCLLLQFGISCLRCSFSERTSASGTEFRKAILGFFFGTCQGQELQGVKNLILIKTLLKLWRQMDLVNFRTFLMVNKHLCSHLKLLTHEPWTSGHRDHLSLISVAAFPNIHDTH